MVKMLNVIVSHPVTDLIHFQIGLHEKLLCMEKAQIVQVRNKAAAAFLGKSCAEIFFVQRNIVCYHLQTQFRIGIVILQKATAFWILSAPGRAARRAQAFSTRRRNPRSQSESSATV